MASLTLVTFALLALCASAHDLLPAPVHMEYLPDGSLANTDPFYYRRSSSSRIVGGRDVTDISQAPFMVLIKMRNRSGYFDGLCAGTILNSQWVITASHCLRSFPKEDIVFIAGNVVNHCVEKVCHADKGAQFVGIDRIVHHPQAKYDASRPNDLFAYDIALVKVKPALKLDGVKVARIGLPSSSDVWESRNYDAFGWGVTKWEHDASRFRYSPILKAATIPIRPVSTCRKILNGKAPFSSDSQFCAGGLGGQQPCLGDSGGPLVTQGSNRKIVGVLNYGRVCGEKDEVSVYMNVHKVLSWIKQHVGSGKKRAGAGPYFDSPMEDQSWPSAEW